MLERTVLRIFLSPTMSNTNEVSTDEATDEKSDIRRTKQAHAKLPRIFQSSSKIT